MGAETRLLVFAETACAHGIVVFFNDTATTEIYTLSLHDALPIYAGGRWRQGLGPHHQRGFGARPRSEEHTSELQSPCNLVCRLLLEKKALASGVASAALSLSALLAIRVSARWLWQGLTTGLPLSL